MSSCQLMFPGVGISLESGFVLKPPASGFQSYFYSSLKTSPSASVVKGTCDLPRPTASVALNSSGKPVITWEKVSGATKYTVYIYDADGNLLKTSSTTGTKLTHSSAVKDTTYSYQVVAVHSNSAANSAKSTAVSIKCTK